MGFAEIPEENKGNQLNGKCYMSRRDAEMLNSFRL